MSGNITIDSTTKALMDDAATGEAARMFLQSDLGNTSLPRLQRSVMKQPRN